MQEKSLQFTLKIRKKVLIMHEKSCAENQNENHLH